MEQPTDQGWISALEAAEWHRSRSIDYGVVRCVGVDLMSDGWQLKGSSLFSRTAPGPGVDIDNGNVGRSLIVDTAETAAGTLQGTVPDRRQTWSTRNMGIVNHRPVVAFRSQPWLTVLHLERSSSFQLTYSKRTDMVPWTRSGDANGDRTNQQNLAGSLGLSGVGESQSQPQPLGGLRRTVLWVGESRENKSKEITESGRLTRLDASQRISYILASTRDAPYPNGDPPRSNRERCRPLSANQDPPRLFEAGRPSTPQTPVEISQNTKHKTPEIRNKK